MTKIDIETGYNKLTTKLNKDDIEKYVINPVMRIEESSGGTGGSETESVTLDEEDDVYNFKSTRKHRACQDKSGSNSVEESKKPLKLKHYPK